MVFSYHQVQEHPKLFLAMTGLSHAEFHQLLPHFQYAWDQYVQQHYVDRDDRRRQYGAGRSESTLVHIEDKLLFILYYVKVYPGLDHGVGHFKQHLDNLRWKGVLPRLKSDR
jgi:hypothetical protein